MFVIASKAKNLIHAQLLMIVHPYRTDQKSDKLNALELYIHFLYFFHRKLHRAHEIARIHLSLSASVGWLVIG